MGRIGARTLKHFENHFAQGLPIEQNAEAWEKGIANTSKPFLASETIRGTAKRYSTNPFLLKATPLAFTVFYAVNACDYLVRQKVVAGPALEKIS